VAVLAALNQSSGLFEGTNSFLSVDGKGSQKEGQGNFKFQHCLHIVRTSLGETPEKLPLANQNFLSITAISRSAK
jgi:hypothetical protein